MKQRATKSMMYPLGLIHTRTHACAYSTKNTHSHLSTVHTSILISRGKQCKEWLHFEKKKKCLVLIMQSNARARLTVSVWTVCVRLFFSPPSLHLDTEGEVTTSTKRTLSSAPAFLLFHSPCASRVREHTPAASL